MGFLDWGDRLDDRVITRLRRPPESLRTADTEVSAWWDNLSREERNRFLLDVERSVVFRDPLLARARVAAMEFYGPRSTNLLLLAFLPAVVGLGLAALLNDDLEISFSLTIIVASIVLMIAAARRIQRERVETAKVIADLTAQIAERRPAPPD